VFRRRAADGVAVGAKVSPGLVGPVVVAWVVGVGVGGLWVGMSELGRLVGGGDDDVPPSLWPADGETVVVGLDAGVVGGGVGKG